MRSFKKSEITEARLFTEKLAAGVNPLTGEIESEDTLLNHPEVIRKMFLIKDILAAVLENSISAKTSDKRAPEELPEEALAKFEYDKPKSLTKLLEQIYAPVKENGIKQITAVTVNRWLMAAGLLEEISDPSTNRRDKQPTAAGEALGISMKKGFDSRNSRDYYTLIYNKSAQMFIVNNINRIINGEVLEVQAA
ncbi:MAG: hypothetical protein K6A74_02860 [Lachnospiraceae bacterium]|nr:hypothetical protein [Lachnospiraceae bacterium]